MDLPIGQKLSNQAALGPDFAKPIISETTGWIYTIWRSIELSRPVVVQHHTHLTLTLDFHGQILKMLYLWNGGADWHGTKEAWIDRMLHPLCDFQRSPHPFQRYHFFQNLTLKMQGQGHGWGQSESHKVGITSYRLTSLSFHVNRPSHPLLPSAAIVTKCPETYKPQSPSNDWVTSSIH